MLRRILHSKQFIMGLTLVLILCFIAILRISWHPMTPMNIIQMPACRHPSGFPEE